MHREGSKAPFHGPIRVLRPSLPVHQDICKHLYVPRLLQWLRLVLSAQIEEVAYLV